MTTIQQLKLVTAAAVITGLDDVEAFVIGGDRVLACGGARDLREAFPNASVHSFENCTIVPGFNDAHTHPSMVAPDLDHILLDPETVGSLDALKRRLTNGVRETQAGYCVRAIRYDEQKSTGGRSIDRVDLDAVSTTTPIFVQHISGLWGVTNTPGLALAGLSDSSEDPDGGHLGRDASGRLTGVVHGRAQAGFDDWYTDDVYYHRPTEEREAELLSQLLTRYSAAGVTSVGDAMVLPHGLRAYQRLRQSGRLPLRVDMLLNFRLFDQLRDLGMTSGLGDDWLRVSGIKAAIDGAVAAGTCLVEEPYEGTDSHGMQNTSDEEMHQVVSAVASSGTRIGIHANGDRAIRKVLDIFEQLHSDLPPSGPRHRIEHCTIVDDDILTRMKRLNLCAVPHGNYVRYHGDKLVSYYGRSRLERMFAHRSFLDKGICVGGSSDYPCSPLEPLAGIASCVTRRSLDGEVLGENQRITRREALFVYTQGSAMTFEQDGYKGLLSPGYLADFVVLGENPLTVPDEAIADIPVLQTWVGGEPIWRRADAA